MTSWALAEALAGLPPGGWVELWAPAEPAAWVTEVVTATLREVPEGQERLRVGVGPGAKLRTGKMRQSMLAAGLVIEGGEYWRWPDVWEIGKRRAGRPNQLPPRQAGVCAHPACQAPLPGRKRVWHDDWCVTLWYALFGRERMSEVVMARDGLLCALCGCPLRSGRSTTLYWETNVHQLEREHRQLFRLDTREADLQLVEVRDALRRIQVAEVDHIRPIQYGGDEWDAANLRVLCPACHAGERRAQRARWADDWETMRAAPPWLVVRTGTELWVPAPGNGQETAP